MSDSSPNGAPSQPQSLPPSPGLPNLPELAILAEKLQEASEALRVFCQAASPTQTGDPRDAAIPYSFDRPGNVDGTAMGEGEIRCYYFSPPLLRHERELLKKYKAKDFPGLLAEAHTLLVGLVRLMKSTHPDARLKGYALSSLGSLLDQASALTLRMRNVYSKAERVKR